MKSKREWDRAREGFREALDNLLAAELKSVRNELLVKVADNGISLLSFTETVIEFWHLWLKVDRSFVCDMKDGKVIAGWNRGKNIVKLQDWHEHYVPLEDDRTLQAALESDDLIAAPVDGEGADLAFSIRFPDGNFWLVVLDETNVARLFTPRDMAHIEMARDLILIKARLLGS